MPNDSDALSLPPFDRITPARVRAFINLLSAEIRVSSVALYAHNLYQAARLIAPTTDWAWLKSLKSRLLSRAHPEDRFDRLVPPWGTLDLGIELMEEALKLPVTGHKRRETQYRDGLFFALLSVWPIRRRSIAALTVSHHVELDDLGANILLHPADTKARRAESLRVPEELLPYLRRYLEEIRPRLLGRRHHDGLWASYQGRPLSEGRLYDIARARVFHRFGKLMGLHDFRRAAATFVAMHAPEKIGLIPGVLQHASPDVSEQHYNLARSMQAGHRFAAHLSENRNKLRSVLPSSEG
jgi:integrase